MPDWKRIIDQFFRLSDPDGSYDHFSPNGASADTVAKLEAELGIKLPDELRDFYSNCDGLGLIPRNGSEMPLFVRPTNELLTFISQCRSSFSDTHPRFAEHYLPCIDWHNGDSSGYMMDSDGTFMDGIYTFSHEHYSYDAEQDVNEFLLPQAESIAALLSPD